MRKRIIVVIILMYILINLSASQEVFDHFFNRRTSTDHSFLKSLSSVSCITRDFADDENTIEEQNYKDDDEDDNPLAFYAFMIILGGATSPYWLPLAFIEEGDYPEPYFYQSYPFAEEDCFLVDSGREWMGKMNMRYQILQEDRECYKIEGSYSFSRLGFESGYDQYTSTKSDDKVESYQFMFLYDFAERYDLRFRSGIGYHHFETEVPHSGLCHSYIMEAYYRKIRFSVKNYLTMYNIEIEEKVEWNNNLTVNLGYFINRIEILLSYNWRTLGEEYFYGPELGLSIWF